MKNTLVCFLPPSLPLVDWVVSDNPLCTFVDYFTCTCRDQDLHINRRQLYKSSFLSLDDADRPQQPSQDQLEGVRAATNMAKLMMMMIIVKLVVTCLAYT